jgi:hypothetical protein
VIPYQRRILDKLAQYLSVAPLVARKIISIVALLSIHALPNGSNPVKVFAFLLSGGNMTPEDGTVTPIDYTILNVHDIEIILTFAVLLIEPLPKVKFSRQEEYNC